MSDRLFVGTRKGLFRIERRGAGRWQIEHSLFLGEPVSAVLPDLRDGSVYVTLRHGHFGAKVHRSEDGGDHFLEIQAPAFSEQASNPDDPHPWSVSQIWCLEAGGGDESGTLWAGTLPGALFRSPDRGESWQLIRALWERPERMKWSGGGYDVPGIHSICVDPRSSKRITVAISIGGVWMSEDGGGSWQSRCDGMFAEYVPPDLRGDANVQDPHRVVQCRSDAQVFWAQHHNGVFRSRDGAATWSEIRNVAPSVFGFAVAAHPRDPETAWFVPAVKDECRVPVDGRLVVARTRNGGADFETLREGLPQEHAYDLVYRHGLDVDESGERLAMGSTTGSLWVSEDGGNSWECVSNLLPPIYALRFGGP